MSSRSVCCILRLKTARLVRYMAACPLRGGVVCRHGLRDPQSVIRCMAGPLIRGMAVPVVRPQILKGHESVIRCMAVDGDRIVTGSSDKTVGVGAAGCLPSVVMLQSGQSVSSLLKVELRAPHWRPKSFSHFSLAHAHPQYACTLCY